MRLPQLVVLAERGDAGAVALACVVRRRRRCSVRLVDQAEIARAVVRHVPQAGPVPGPASGSGWAVDSVELRGGEMIGSGVDCVLCRAGTFEPRRFVLAEDHEYATAEMHALGLSWLWGLSDAVVNRPTLGSLGGRAPDMLTLSRMAAQVGLATPEIRLTTNAASHGAGAAGAVGHRWNLAVPGSLDTLEPMHGPPLAVPVIWSQPLGPLRTTALVCGDDVVDAPPMHGRQLVELCQLIGVEVAEATFAGRPDAPVLVGLDPVPTLRQVQHLVLLAKYVERRAALRFERAADLGAEEVIA